MIASMFIFALAGLICVAFASTRMIGVVVLVLVLALQPVLFLILLAVLGVGYFIYFYKRS